MIHEIFINVFNMSITAGYIIIAVMLTRLILKKAPKKFSYLLWSVVGFRLAVPISFQSVFSLFSLKPFDIAPIKSTENGSLNYLPSTNKPIISENTNTIINNAVQSTNAGNEMNIVDGFTNIFSQIWFWVMLLIIIYGAISYITLKIKVRNAVLKEKNIYECDVVSSPFILGFIFPKIYIPFRLDDKTYQYVIAHEKCHLQRRDYYIKALAFILLAIHWFNPLCWVAFALMTTDMEMSCDEKVISKNNDIRGEYSTAILSFAVKKKLINATPLCFNESNIKTRIKNILRFKKPRLIISIFSGILCLAIIIGCALNPPKKVLDEPLLTVESETIADSNPIDSFISDSILINEKRNHTINNSYLGEGHYLFGTVNGNLDGNNTDKCITVYAYTKIVNLSVKNDILTKDSEGSHPCAIVFQKNKDDYTFDTYWTPKEKPGFFQEDIKKAFPKDILAKYNAFIADFKTYNNTITNMTREAYNQVIEKYGINIDSCIEAAFKTFDSPVYYANPDDYIDKESEAYKSLINCDQYTIRYIYSKFLEGRQYNLSGQFYRIIMDDIIGDESLKLTAGTGQDYFIEFLKRNRNLLIKNNEEFMKSHYPYGYMLLEMIDGGSNTAQIQIIDNLIKSITEKQLDNYNSITEMIAAITNSEYIGDFGSGFYIYKFKYNSYISFYISLADTDTFKPFGVTYYLNDMEYAYQNFQYPFELEITTQSTDNRINRSENINTISPQEATKIASNEIKKEKYSEYYYALHKERIPPSLSYRPIIRDDYTFIYSNTADYCYFVGLTINEDDDPYNSCSVVVNAENGNIMAVDFVNTYDMV